MTICVSISFTVLIRILNKERFFSPSERFKQFCLIVPYVKLPYYKLLWNNKIVAQLSF